jgi:putative hydrolase of the HAD superfamily
MSKDIKIVFFDVGSVLLYRKRHALEAISTNLNFDLDKAKKAHHNSTKHKDFDKKYKNMRDLDGQHEFSVYAAKLFLDEIGLPHKKDMIDVIEKAWTQQEFELMPDAIEILDYLKDKYRLGVISNGMPSRRHYELVDFELLHYFDPIVLSREVGIEKPDNKIFELALEMASVQASEVAFIDDQPSYLKGAYDTGIKNLFQFIAEVPNRNAILHTTKKDVERYNKAILITKLNQLKDYL